MNLQPANPPTQNFAYEYDADVPGTDVRVWALQATCETDLARLESLFGVTGGFGPNHRVTVSVENLEGVAGVNGGYATDVEMAIRLNFGGSGPSAVRQTRTVFVNEMAEIMMGYRDRVTGSPTWNKGHSDFEGLSRVCGDTLYPSSGSDEGVESWIGQNPRDYQYIDTTDPNGENDLSHSASWGISMLFIYYLQSQLGFSLSDIIQKAGRTLAQTCHNLTGRQDARQAFHDLIEQFLPAGKVSSLERNNPFPLLPPQRRSVSLSYSTEITEGPEIPGTANSTTRSPGWICPPSTYHYAFGADTDRETRTANVHGFARPVFRWTVAGIRPPPPGPNDVSVVINPTVSVGDKAPPFDGAYTWATQQASVDFDTWPQNEVHIKNLDHLGLIEQFPVTVEVIDEFAYPDWATATTATDNLSLLPKSIRWEPRYYEDKKRCEDEERDFILRHVRYRELVLLLTLPDPQPLNIAAVIGKIIFELGVLAREMPEEGVAVAETVAQLLGVSSAQLLEGQLSIPTRELDIRFTHVELGLQ